jgi:hypothetical protein
MALPVEEINNTNQITKDNHQHPCKSFGQKCNRVVMNQRAKFYIFRRCIAMLLCWNEHERELD